MTVYIVITNGEVKGELEGVYQTYEDAKRKFNEIKEDWKLWAEGNECEEDDEEDYYSLTNYDEDEFLELKLIAETIQ